MNTVGYAVDGPEVKFHTWEFKRREVGDNDILIQIEYCGICHSDIHQVKDDWGGAKYPMVPGHEMVGKVVKVGSKVTKFKEGDHAGVGCFVDSCGQCSNCTDDKEEQFCQKGAAMSYNSTEMDKKTPTYGGYSTQITIKEHYALKIHEKTVSKLAAVAPLLCAGITTYSPLKRHNMGKGKKVGIVGLGGLGHMAVKIAAAMGAEVTVFSTSPNKEEDAKKLGATHFIVSKDEKAMKDVAKHFDMIMDTVSANHPIAPFLDALKVRGTLVLVGVPTKPHEVNAFQLLMGNKSIEGTLIGGIQETQEMLDFCAEHDVYSEIELISYDKTAEAYERTEKADVKYRFVIDINTLRNAEKKA